MKFGDSSFKFGDEPINLVGIIKFGNEPLHLAMNKIFRKMPLKLLAYSKRPSRPKKSVEQTSDKIRTAYEYDYLLKSHYHIILSL